MTTPVHTFTVTPVPPTSEAAPAKVEEKIVAKKGREGEAAGNLSLDGSSILVSSSHAATIKLVCVGTATCSGRLTLLASVEVERGRTRHTHTEAIAASTFSIPAGRTAIVDLGPRACVEHLVVHARRGFVSATAALDQAPT